MKICGIYLIINCVNGKIYIGSANDVVKRWEWHRKFLNDLCHHNIVLQRAWIKYGEDAFHFCVVEKCNKEDLLKIEQLWIDGGTDYNIHLTAGSPLGWKHTPESLAKISLASKGKKPSEETRKRMSEAHKNRSWDHILNHAAAMKKRGITPEHKQKLKEANMKRGYKFKN